MNGPSVMKGLPSRTRTLVDIAVGCSGAASRYWPLEWISLASRTDSSFNSCCSGSGSRAKFSSLWWTSRMYFICRLQPIVVRQRGKSTGDKTFLHRSALKNATNCGSVSAACRFSDAGKHTWSLSWPSSPWWRLPPTRCFAGWRSAATSSIPFRSRRFGWPAGRWRSFLSRGCWQGRRIGERPGPAPGAPASRCSPMPRHFLSPMSRWAQAWARWFSSHRYRWRWSVRRWNRGKGCRSCNGADWLRQSPGSSF